MAVIEVMDAVMQLLFVDWVMTLMQLQLSRMTYFPCDLCHQSSVHCNQPFWCLCLTAFICFLASWRPFVSFAAIWILFAENGQREHVLVLRLESRYLKMYIEKNRKRTFHSIEHKIIHFIHLHFNSSHCLSHHEFAVRNEIHSTIKSLSIQKILSFFLKKFLSVLRHSHNPGLYYFCLFNLKIEEKKGKKNQYLIGSYVHVADYLNCDFC